MQDVKPAESSVESSAEDVPQPSQAPEQWNWKAAFGLLFIVLIIGGAWPAWNRWLEYRDEQYLAACKSALEAENWKLLEVVAANWHQDSPQNGYPWLYRADAAIGLKNYEDAARYMGSLPTDDPKYAAAMLKKIDLEFGLLNDPFAAVETCQQVISIEPRTTEAHQRLIFFYAMTYQREKLIEAIRSAIEVRREPKEAFIYLLGKDWLIFSNGYELNQHWLEQYPDEELFHVGTALSLPYAANPLTHRPGQQELMESYVDRFPQNLEVIVYQLAEASQDGDDAEVARLLSDLPASYQDDNRIWRYKGWLEQYRGDYTAAIESYEYSLKIHPVDWRTQQLLSEVFRLDNQPENSARYAVLGDEGKSLEKTILELPNVTAVSLELILRIADYFTESGDSQTAEVIMSRIGP